MDKPNKKRKNDTSDGFEINVSSTMDCTGLIPSIPMSDEELDSYKEMYDIGTDAKQKKR